MIFKRVDDLASATLSKPEGDEKWSVHFWMFNLEQLPMKKVLNCLVLFLMTLLSGSNSWAGDLSISSKITEKERNALFPSRDIIEFGRIAAQANCADCHGMDGISNEAGTPHLAGQRTVYLYRVLKSFQSGERVDQLKNHNTFLNDDVLLSTAVYYSNLSPVNVARSEPSEQDDESSGEPVDDPFLSIRSSMRRCVKCHGEDGNSNRAGMPSLTAQDPEYFVTSMMAYVDGSRNHRLMGRLVESLDEATIRQMGVFYAVQEPAQTETLGEGDINVGRRLSAECASCHGDDGNAANPSMPTLAGQDAKYFIKGMNHYKNGERQHEKMFEAVEQLSEQDMIDLASYYASQKPVRRNIRKPLNSAEWIMRCERCHGIDGNSRDPRFPMLAGQDKTYLKQAMQDYVSGIRQSTTMHAMATPLSPLDIERIAGYFASQQAKPVVFMQLPCEDNQ